MICMSMIMKMLQYKMWDAAKNVFRGKLIAISTWL